jgi:hypothetical protein
MAFRKASSAGSPIVASALLAASGLALVGRFVYKRAVKSESQP